LKPSCPISQNMTAFGDRDFEGHKLDKIRLYR
jgi:hypothetical protein